MHTMILITGGTGFVGSHVIELLATRGARVRSLARRPVPGVDSILCDLASRIPSDALVGVDTVLHLAGVTKALSPADYYSGNVRATENLARAVAATGRPIRFVHVSSLAAVGPSPDAQPLLEDASPHPLTHYGKSKLEGERAARAILPDAVIVRPPVVYGPRDTDVFEMLKSVHRGLCVKIAGGERYFSAIFVRDLAEGILRAAEEPCASGRDYFLAHPRPASWTELTETAAVILNRKPRTIEVPMAVARAAGFFAELQSKITRKPGIVSREKVREAECPYWLCDPARAKAELNFEAATGLEPGLRETLDWYLKAGWLK